MCRGKEEIGSVLSARYEKIPDMRWEEIKHWVVDDTKAISEWIVRGTFEDNSKLDCLGCDLWEFRDGLITKKILIGKSLPTKIPKFSLIHATNFHDKFF